MKDSIDKLSEARELVKTALAPNGADNLSYAIYNKMAPELHEICLLIFDFMNAPDIRNLSGKQPGSLLEKIEITEEKIQQVQDTIKTIGQSSARLLEREDELKTEETNLKQLKEKIDWLKELEKYVADGQIQELEELISMKKGLHKKKLSQLNEKIGQLNELLCRGDAGMDTLLFNGKILKENVLTLEENGKEGIRLLSDGIKVLETRFNDVNKEYNTLRLEYLRNLEKLKDIFQQLEEIEEKHADNLSIYRKHFEADRDIWGRLEDRGTTLLYIEQLNRKLDEELMVFDEKLRDILRNKEILAKREQGWKKLNI